MYLIGQYKELLDRTETDQIIMLATQLPCETVIFLTRKHPKYYNI